MQKLFLITHLNWVLSVKDIRNAKYFSALKGSLSGLRQFLTTENSLKMMKNVFYFSIKALFVLKILRFLS